MAALGGKVELLKKFFETSPKRKQGSDLINLDISINHVPDQFFQTQHGVPGSLQNIPSSIDSLSDRSSNYDLIQSSTPTFSLASDIVNHNVKVERVVNGFNGNIRTSLPKAKPTVAQKPRISSSLLNLSHLPSQTLSNTGLCNVKTSSTKPSRIGNFKVSNSSNLNHGNFGQFYQDDFSDLFRLKSPKPEVPTGTWIAPETQAVPTATIYSPVSKQRGVDGKHHSELKIHLKLETKENIPFSNTILSPCVNRQPPLKNLSNAKPQNSSQKKPPPVPKKTCSLKKGICESPLQLRPQNNYRKALDERWGGVQSPDPMLRVEAWNNANEITLNYQEKNPLQFEGKQDVLNQLTYTNGFSNQRSNNSDGETTPSVSSRPSILKKNSTRGPPSTKRIAFKKDDQLTSSFTYPSEHSFSNDSRSSQKYFFVDSDSDRESGSSSNNDFAPFVGQPTGSSCSTLVSERNTIRSSSTLCRKTPTNGHSRTSSPTLKLGSSASSFAESFKRFLP